MIDALIDKLTNSIEEVATGRTLVTDVQRATLADLKSLEKQWQFDWLKESRRGDVYKLTVPSIGLTIFGLISVEPRADHVFVHLLESHPENVGRRKKFAGIPGNLMAFAARLSRELGHEGCLTFESKSALLSHYQKTLGARRIGRSRLMVVDEAAADRLIQQYFGGSHGNHS